ncbi:MAG: fused MFS/spermidine synthase [Vicinamibacterales bacterium]
MPWLFLVAYTCSGIAGLVYEVSWTRLLTLHIGHTTAAAAAVVAAFLGGLAVGAAWGGDIASTLSPSAALRAYVRLELGVAAAALALPWELRALTPFLSWAYGEGGPGLLFPTVRLASCLVMVFIPAAALGATFPMAIRWFASESGRPARQSGVLYALNTAGAAVGAMLAGFVLVPAIGISGATWVGITGSVVAALAVAVVTRNRADGRGEAATAADGAEDVARAERITRRRDRVRASSRTEASASDTGRHDGRWLAAGVLGLSGFASLMHEIAWTRILALVLGPTTYAFAATLAAVIGGVAIGSAAGAWMVGRAKRPAAWVAIALALGAITTSYTYSLAGQRIPRLVARQMATAADPFSELLTQGLLLTAALILPTAICLGAAFPLALSLAGDHAERVAGRFGMVYAVNTLGAVAGSLAAGFFFIPRFGLQVTLQVVSGCLIAAASIVIVKAALTGGARTAGVLASLAAALVLVLSPPWDRELLASGPYMYAPFVPRDLDLETMLKAGTMLYYREGAAATVTVKRLTGTTTLAVDGKVDASNRGDMLTQKLIAHLPLLVHDDPRDVAIIGLGSGVTVGSALRHPIARADVIEISPEVVDASRFFEAENHRALDDPRTHLIVGDGRSHLLLTPKKYDVIVSEPSNPWIAGVAALFTREFFEGARDRLAPGGVICQWANAYNISEADLRSIVATFLSVFPHGTVWLVGGDDVLMMASDGPLDARLEKMGEHWQRPGVAEDLALVAALDPFSVLSLYIGGPDELRPYVEGAPLFTDDTMRLEFSAPREIHSGEAGANVTRLSALAADGSGPAAVREARSRAGAAEWRNRGLMMATSDVHGRAYDDFKRALEIDLTDKAALDGLVRAAGLTGQSPFAVETLEALSAGRPPQRDVLVALSKARAAAGLMDEAVEAAREAARVDPPGLAGLEQLASIYADAGNTVPLDDAVATMRRVAPDRAPTLYYAAAAAFLHGDAQEAARLAERAISADPAYAPVYDLAGAAYTKLGRLDEARKAFEMSLTFDPHDSAAYTNLGLLAMESGDRAAARGYFAEALWLAPDSAVAREGLARTR